MHFSGLISLATYFCAFLKFCLLLLGALLLKIINILHFKSKTVDNIIKKPELWGLQEIDCSGNEPHLLTFPRNAYQSSNYI